MQSTDQNPNWLGWFVTRFSSWGTGWGRARPGEWFFMEGRAVGCCCWMLLCHQWVYKWISELTEIFDPLSIYIVQWMRIILYQKIHENYMQICHLSKFQVFLRLENTPIYSKFPRSNPHQPSADFFDGSKLLAATWRLLNGTNWHHGAARFFFGSVVLLLTSRVDGACFLWV